ncbi:uncharacterized protein L969DRAFT_93933 [Mixia osmundae IAM 14324]|uniref:ubiquitinyl hydrolase 1 n=1 Tax=Mixia osmundae (strain CBS 9802 / IAM 14324 / JCM 22182 / KY 12970) TaxID=764103 RepID=G7EA04_MIXOS|nr:uncharacterized protein L969DRAFT_93933 [Mixia osmundae IAM 14324]KEI40107.1 hypothetical protein L969DRAFT_93933 [Mixia osmundae IAM 14324]GAA99473.1 hypothetical protein E5Q_06172 [Mixia osmundae IAM 14324]
MRTLAELKSASVVQPDNRYGIKSYLAQARKLSDEAEALEHKGDAESAYLALRRWAGVMSVINQHPEHPTMRKLKGPEYMLFMDLSQRVHSAGQKMNTLARALQARDEEARASTSSPHDLPSLAHSNGTTSIASSALHDFTPPLTPSKRAAQPASPAGSAAESAPPSTIRERLLALRNAGLDTGAQPQEGLAGAHHTRPGAARQTTHVASSRPAPPPHLPLGATSPVSERQQATKPIALRADVNGHPGTAAPSPFRSAPELQHDERPGSAPAQLDSEHDKQPEPAPSPTGHIRPQLESDNSYTRLAALPTPSYQDFESHFPAVEKLSDLPGVPPSKPGASTVLGRPPTPPDFSRPVEPSRRLLPVSEHAYAPDSLALGSSRPPPASSQSPLQSIASKTHPTVPSIALPRANSILPAHLWQYLEPTLKTNEATTDSSLSILLLDLRTRPEFEARRIAGKTVCLEPVTLRNEISSQRLESSLVLSPEIERDAFAKRHTFDLIIFYDRSSSKLPVTPPVSASTSIDDPARILYNLLTAVYEREFAHPLKRSPMLLIGGWDAWQREIGDRGTVGEKLNEPSRPARPALGNIDINAGRQRSESQPSARLPESAYLLGPAPTASDEAAVSINGREAALYKQGNSSARSSDSSFQDLGYFKSHDVSSGSLYGHPSASSPIAIPALAAQRQVVAPAFDAFATPTSALLDQSRQPRELIYDRRPIDYPQINRTALSMPQRPPLAAISYNEPMRPQPSRSNTARTFSSFNQSSSQLSPITPGWTDRAMNSNFGDGTVGLTGLKNMGNTCYMNSTIQCLSATIPLARFFKDGSYRRAINRQNPMGTQGVLADAVGELIKVLWTETYNFVAPVSFRDAICRFAPQFRGTDQHDSQEFLAFLLDGLHEDLNFVVKKPRPVEMTPEREAALESLPTQVASEKEWQIYTRRNNSVIVNWFQGQYRNRLQCLTCGKTSTTYDTFMYLSLPLPNKSRSEVSLQQCLDAFVKEEVLEKSEAWNCPRCKTRRKATKRLTLSRLPPILLIHFKRFSFKGPFSERLDTVVRYPLSSLDLTNYLPPPLPPATANLYNVKPETVGPTASSSSYRYDLYAVSNHFGSLSSGHYTAFVKNNRGWWSIGDSRVSKASDSDVQHAGKSVYILCTVTRGSAVFWTSLVTLEAICANTQAAKSRADPCHSHAADYCDMSVACALAYVDGHAVQGCRRPLRDRG